MTLPPGVWIWFGITRGGGTCTPSPAATADVAYLLSEAFIVSSPFGSCGGGPAGAGATGLLGGPLPIGTSRLLLRRGEMAANGEAATVEGGD